MRLLVLILSILWAAAPAAGQTSSLPAFPEAEGFGMFTQGGRGGEVYFVTNLLDYESGEHPIRGSLRAAVAASEPRTILFRVSGTIELKRILDIEHPYVTIAGQSAPGGGVTLKNYGIDIDASDVIIRYLRVRPGDVTGEELDAINIRSSNVIVDHCSTSWATDETVSVVGDATNVSVQWCLIAESLNASVHSKGEHGYGSLISTSGNVSLHHNIYALHKSRNPRPRDVLLDFRNNVVYGWGDRAGYNGDDHTRMNYVGNYLLPLDFSDNDRYAFTVGGEDTRIFLDNNLLRRPDGGVRTGWEMIRPPSSMPDTAAAFMLGVEQPFSAPSVTTDDPETALERLLADAGATRPRRDAADRRVIGLIRDRRGAIIDSQNEVGGWPPLDEGVPSPDEDRDGMDDRWEERFGLDSKNPSDHSQDPDGDGYTNLEEYLNGTEPTVDFGGLQPPVLRPESGSVFTAASQSTSDQPWYIRMAESVMERNPTLMNRWHYEVGLMMKAFERLYERTGNERYYAYVKHNLDQFVQPDGSIRTYNLTDYNLDQIASGKLLFSLHERTGDDRYRRAADTLRRQLEEHPRTSEGGFWHKKVYPYQLWLDGVYMAGPFLARYGSEFDDPEAFDEVTRDILLVTRYMRDPATGLYYHGWDESREQAWADPETGLSENFWGRGMGWYGMALVDVLDYLPDDHRDRDQIIRVLRWFAEAVVNVQDPVTGLWYQVLDEPQRPENYLEASASNMFIYALAKGVRMGYLDTGYLDVGRRAYAGVLEHFINADEAGHVSLDGTVSVGGLGGKNQRDGSFGYYMSEPIRMNDNKGVGPFIMAGLELDTAEKTRAAR